MPATKSEQGGPGVGVDIHGVPVIDPTRNVLDLVHAAITRIDDLNAMTVKLTNEQNSRATDQYLALQREIELRAEHQIALDQLEAKRIDSQRSVDQLAIKTESDRSATAITALATAATATAETLRNAVNTSAANLATQLDRTVTAITERIASLEKSAYMGAGKQQVADPQMERLAGMVENLVKSQATGTGKSEGISTFWVVLVAVAGLILTLVAVATAVVTFKNSGEPKPVYIERAK